MFEDDPFEYVRRDLLETAGGGEIPLIQSVLSTPN